MDELYQDLTDQELAGYLRDLIRGFEHRGGLTDDALGVLYETHRRLRTGRGQR